MSPARTVAFASLLIGAIHTPARAALSDADAQAPVVAVAPEPSPVVTHAHAIGVDVGFASAVGAFGITFTQALRETFRVEAGLGAGVSGVQLSLMPKLVLGGARDHFVTGVGVAYTFPYPPAARTSSGNPVWLNVDALGYEHLFGNGVAFSVAVGFTRGLGGGRACVFNCESDADEQDVRRLAGPQARMGFAYWF